MIQNFDYFKNSEIPYLVLCNPDGTQLYSLDNVYDFRMTLRYNATSEIEFRIPEFVNGERLYSYPYISSRRYIFVENIGYFIIMNPEEELDGLTNIKKVTAISVEIELNHKRLVSYSGTKKFGDLLQEILSEFPNWQIGYIDPKLENVYRTFDISDITVYNFLIEEAEKAFGCIFLFDYKNRLINSYARENATINTNIYVSFDNVIKNLRIKEKSDELTTCFHVKGKDELDIRNVNPLGTDTIYDFSYFMNKSWMTGELKSRIIEWQSKIESKRAEYSILLTQLVDANDELNELEADLTTKTNELNTQNAIMQARIESGQPYDDVIAAINVISGEIYAINVLISSTETVIENLTEDLAIINQECSIKNNFSIEQQKILSSYIIENIYSNDTFVQTDSMTNAEVQAMSEELYQFAQDVLSRTSQPRIEFSIDIANFVFIQDFKPFIDELRLGSKISIEINENNVIFPVLLEISIDYENLEEISMTFGNSLRIDDPSFIYSDLYGQTIKMKTGGKLTGGKTETINTGPAAENRTLTFVNGVYKGFTYN